MQRLIFATGEQKIVTVRALLDKLGIPYEEILPTGRGDEVEFIVSDDNFRNVMTMMEFLITNNPLPRRMHKFFHGNVPPLGGALMVEIERVAEKLRKAWEEWEPEITPLEWLIIRYPAFAGMAAAMIEDRSSPATLAWEGQYRKGVEPK